MSHVNRNLIEKDYPGCQIVAVEEYYKPGVGFSVAMNDGNYCFTTDRDVDATIIEIYKNGGTSVNLKIKTANNRTVFKDYFTKSIVSQ